MPARRTDHECRVNRILKRAVPEVKKVLEHGALGVKTLERISRLSPAKQHIELARRLELRKANAERQAVWRNDPKSRGRYMSDSYAEAKKRRVRRIGRTAIPALTDAFNAGQLSLHR